MCSRSTEEGGGDTSSSPLPPASTSSSGTATAGDGWMLRGGKICAVVAYERQRMEEEEGMPRLSTRLVFNLCAMPSPYMLVSAWSR
jgi:hypothetical protein